MDIDTTGAIVAQLLLETQAIHLATEQPFVLRSGWASPVYVDMRALIASVEARRKITDLAQALVLRKIGAGNLDAIAGAETAGIPFAAWLADRLDLPLLIVRKKPLGFGRHAQIEGSIGPGARVLLLDDLTTDGQSKINFLRALRTAGLQVEHVLSLFYYDTFDARTRFQKEQGVTLHALATWSSVLAYATAHRALQPAALSEIANFLEHPAEWSEAHGGISRLP